MKEIFKSNIINDYDGEQWQQVTIYKLTEEESDTASDLNGYELGDFFGYDLRHYPVEAGAIYFRYCLTVSGRFLTVLKIGAYNI